MLFSDSLPNEYNNVCEYVRENIDSYIEFSESRLTLLEKENIKVPITADGDLQPLRNIVMKNTDFAERCYGYDLDHEVHYEFYGPDNTVYSITYKKDIKTKYRNNLLLGEYTFISSDIMVQLVWRPYK